MAAQDAPRSGRPPPPAAGQWPPVLATRNARLLLATRLTGQTADGLLQAALGSFVLFSPERQTSAAQVAGTFAILLLPYSLVGPFAGVLLDRWSRARILVVANLLRSGANLAVIPLVAAGHDGIDLGLVVLTAMGLGRLVLAGLTAGLPRTVPRSHLVTANALFPTAGTICSGMATVTGILLSTQLGPDAPEILVAAVAVLLVCAAGVASLIPRRALGPDSDDLPRTSIRHDAWQVVVGLAAGVRHLHARPPARRIVAQVSCMRFIFGAALVDTLLIVRNTLNTPAQVDSALADFAFAGAAASVGSLCAAFLAPWASRRMGGSRWAGITTLAAAGLTPLGLASHDLGGLAIGSVAMGLAGQSFKIAADTTLQVEVDDDYRGRVFALFDVALNVGLVAGMTVVAFTAPVSGLSPTLWWGLGILLLATGLSSLRRGDRRG